MSNIDFERAMLLFNVAKTASEHGPMYNYIAQAANHELADINNTACDEMTEYNASQKAEEEEAKPPTETNLKPVEEDEGEDYLGEKPKPAPAAQPKVWIDPAKPAPDTNGKRV